MSLAIQADDVRSAAERIRPLARRTPVMTSAGFDQEAGVRAFFKCENLQRGGAFKFRGAYNALSQLPSDQRRRGVVAFSSGNHAQAVALAGQLLDIPRFKGVEFLPDGHGISNDDLDKCAKDQNVEIRRGDFVIVRTGQMERCLKEGKWGGYAGGDAPGVKFENCYWCQSKQIAAICTDTWGVEVRPNETTEANQPWHWVVIPAMGLCMGEIFYLKELSEDCDEDGVYEFFFCGPPLIITGGTGSPINPQAIK